MKQQGRKNIFSILIILDDVADNVDVTRKSKLLHALFTRGRHDSISTIVSSQKFNALHPIIRINATALIVYRLRNQKELDAFLEETSALLDKKTLLDIYNYATKEEYSFLFVNLVAKDIGNMFYKTFKTLIQLDEDE